MDFSTLVKPLLVAGAAFMVYKNVKNEIVQGIAMTALAVVVLKQIPIVNEEI